MAQSPKPNDTRAKEVRMADMDKKIAEFEDWAQRELHLPPLTKEDMSRVKSQDFLTDLPATPKP